MSPIENHGRSPYAIKVDFVAFSTSQDHLRNALTREFGLSSPQAYTHMVVEQTARTMLRSQRSVAGLMLQSALELLEM
jgi:methylphosphotriester-DNA--protein-cysteine methyltransferase